MIQYSLPLWTDLHKSFSRWLNFPARFTFFIRQEPAGRSWMFYGEQHEC